ncbi:dnaJ homolog subfamily C member 22-like [Dreissena polymorpha]|uniref:DnaJ homolog subfamily C member 22 n=1 Tax=Dreissena polymorpha TaxID=45954 RepID=A0A9D4I4C1_DREPO|nr:dnaJ homolog subfamily C member 22-like [Dreissena polymorpha]KAH3749696.1 hypothetical protein DPMN_184202 [Dreissena polymorpha]
MANLTLTFVLWLFGGIFGLHHLYLNRPRHCFIWCVTWGGMFIGWLAEVTQLRHYVDEANQSRKYREHMKVMRTHKPRPSWSVIVLGSQLMIGHQLGKLLICAIPEYYTVETWYAAYLSHLLAALGAALGVHTAANIGPQKAPFLPTFLAAAATVPTSYFLYHQRNIFTLLCVVVASLASSYFSVWAPEKPPSNLIGRLKTGACVGLALTAYSGLHGSSMYFNTRIQTLNGTTIPLPEMVANFLRLQPYDEARELMPGIIQCVRMYGSLDVCQHQFLSQLAEISDPNRDSWAFTVLGFDRYPTQKQINSHCRKLSSKWHPDRFTNKNVTEQVEAELKFMDIQKACGMMNKIKKERERKSTWSESAADQRETVYTDTDDVEETVNTNTHDVGTFSEDEHDKVQNEDEHYDNDDDDENGEDYEEDGNEADESNKEDTSDGETTSEHENHCQKNGEDPC